MYHDPNTNRNKKRNGKVGLGRREEGMEGRGGGKASWESSVKIE